MEEVFALHNVLTVDNSNKCICFAEVEMVINWQQDSVSSNWVCYHTRNHLHDYRPKWTPLVLPLLIVLPGVVQHEVLQNPLVLTEDC